MDFVSVLRHSIDPKVLLEQFGYLGLFLIVFAESGLFFGFFLPGDSLLLIAGVLAAAHILNIWIVLPLVAVAAILGNQTGFWMGSKFGRRIFSREDSWLFHKDHVTRSEAFFAKHGSKAVVISRFIPIVRTFTPIVAGIGSMPARTFYLYNVIGTVLWGIGLTLAGYLLGNIPGINQSIYYIVIAVIIISILPALNHFRPKRAKP